MPRARVAAAGRRGHAGADTVGLGEQGSRFVAQHCPNGRERDAYRGADEQQGAGLGLQLLDRPAQRRLAHVQPGGGPAEVEFLGDRQEVAQGT